MGARQLRNEQRALEVARREALEVRRGGFLAAEDRRRRRLDRARLERSPSVKRRNRRRAAHVARRANR